MADIAIAYADAGRLWSEMASAFLPANRVSVADYAAEHRWLANEGGGYVGRWSHAEAPYLVGPMEALTSELYTTTAIVGPGQCGKTAVAENWLLSNVANDPADMLWYMQTDQGVEAYVKGRINPMIAQHDGLKRNLGKRPIDDSLHYKRFMAMNLEMLSATPSNLINKSAPRIVADEVDAYAKGLGDVKATLDVRRQTFGEASMLLALSHPDLATSLEPEEWGAGIMAIYADSTRSVWYWECPHCGGWSSPAPIAARVMSLHYATEGTLDEIEASARLLCPVGGCLIEDHHRRKMNLGGRWIGIGQEIDEAGAVTGELVRSRTAGFWIVGTMSPFILGGIGGLARARVKAERDFETDPDAEETLRQVMVKQWGVPYEAPKQKGSIDAEQLAERAITETQKLGIVPPGVRFLTGWIDVQIAHFELLVVGWGVGSESWVVDKQRIPADTATDGAAWDKLLGDLIDKRYPLATGTGTMPIRCAGYDSGGAPGVTDQAYNVWRRLKLQNKIRRLGKQDGRDLWSLLPTKGVHQRAPRLKVVYPDSARKDRRVVRTGTVPLALFNSDLFKDALNGRLLQALPGPAYVHLPSALRSKDPPHVNFEQLVSERRRRNGHWEKPHQGIRNEMLDLMVGCHVLAHLHGLARIDWEHPPAWAAPQDRNATLAIAVPIGTEATAQSAASPAPQPTAAPQPATSPATRRGIFDRMVP